MATDEEERQIDELIVRAEDPIDRAMLLIQRKQNDLLKLQNHKTDSLEKTVIEHAATEEAWMQKAQLMWASLQRAWKWGWPIGSTLIVGYFSLLLWVLNEFVDRDKDKEVRLRKIEVEHAKIEVLVPPKE